MGWFHGINVNEQIRLREGNHKVWKFSLDHTCPISLYVKQIDGYGIDIYVMADKEYRNFCQGKVFRYLPDLSFENVGSFDNTVSLGAGTYCLVANLPSIPEGSESYAVAAIRCETLQ